VGRSRKEKVHVGRIGTGKGALGKRIGHEERARVGFSAIIEGPNRSG